MSARFQCSFTALYQLSPDCLQRASPEWRDLIRDMRKRNRVYTAVKPYTALIGASHAMLTGKEAAPLPAPPSGRRAPPSGVQLPLLPLQLALSFPREALGHGSHREQFCFVFALLLIQFQLLLYFQVQLSGYESFSI